MFYQNNKRKTHWAHSSMTATLKPKGNGQLLMVLDFLTIKWGHLCDENKCIFLFMPLVFISLIQTPTVKQESYSKLAKIARVTLVPNISTNKSTSQSISLRRRQMGGPKAS